MMCIEAHDAIIEPVARGRRMTPKAVIIDRHACAAAAAAEKRGVMETAREFLDRRAGDSTPKDLLKYMRKEKREHPVGSDRRQGQQAIRELLPAAGEPSMART